MDYPNRLEVRVLDKKLQQLIVKAVREGELTDSQALKILRLFRFAKIIIDYARDRLN